MPLSIARTSSVPPVISTKEESFFLKFFVLSGAKNTSKTCRHLLEYERETYASFFKEQRVRNTTDTYYEYERETYRRWRLYEAIFVESNFKWVVWWKKTVLGKYRQERVL